MKSAAIISAVILAVAVAAYEYGKHQEQRRIHRDCWTSAQFSVGAKSDEVFTCVSVRYSRP